MPTRTLLHISILLAATACGGGGGGGGEPAVATATTTTATAPAQTADNNGNDLDTELRALIDAAGLTGNAAFNRTPPGIDEPLAQLGMALFFSKSLGGDFDSACVSCHHPSLGGGDSLSLPVGVGAIDADVLGPGRATASGLPNVPRNAPTVFNSGLWDTGMFWDSRVESFGKEPQANGAVSDIRTPDVAFGLADTDAGANLPAAQARFPVTSQAEMRGATFEAGASNAQVREHLAARIGGYGVGAGELVTNAWLAAFQDAFGPGSAETLITFGNIAAALAAYERSMVFVTNPFSAYIQGDNTALTDAQKRGAILFYTAPEDGGGGCVNCHSGDAFTDGAHHTVAFPQFGPGKGDGTGDDFGRERESSDPADRYRFRTPSLLNVSVTAPYGHAGTYETLNQVMAHYNNPNGTVNGFFDDGGACTLAQFEDRADCASLYPDAEAASRAALDKLADERNGPEPGFPNLNLNNNARADLVAFLRALTDPCVEDRDCLAPWVPAEGPGPDGQQLNARDGDGNLL